MNNNSNKISTNSGRRWSIRIRSRNNNRDRNRSSSNL